MRIHNSLAAILQRFRQRLQQRLQSLSRPAASLVLALSLVTLPAGPVPAQSSFGSQSQTSFGNSGSSSFGRSSSSSSYGSNSYGSNGYGSSSSSSNRFGSSSSLDRNSSRNSELNRESGSRNKKTTGKKGKGKGAAVQGKSNVVTRKGGKDKGKKGGGTTQALPAIKISPQAVSDALYFNPTFLDVAPGDRFATSINYFNSKANKVSELDLWVHYDPAVLVPIWVDVAPLKKLNAKDVGVQAWPATGYIRLQSKLQKPPVAAQTELACVHWRSIKAEQETRIEMEAPTGQTVSVLAGGQNMIETSGIGNRMRVSAKIHVVPPTDYESGLRLVSEVADTLTSPPTASAKRLRLAIIAPHEFVNTDEVATADVVVINPAKLAFDDLRFRIRFNADAVQILDADEDNYISRGINIFDGDFHDQFPFDYQIANTVDQERGVIDYHNRDSVSPRVYPGGTVARIVYRMKRQAGKAVFWFEQADPATGETVTDVTAWGRSLLGETPALAADALHGAQVAVRPLDLRVTERVAALDKQLPAPAEKQATE